MKISCIIPAYNEERTIKSVICVLKKIKSIDEIIVVDDGSVDKTFRIAKEQRVIAIRHKANTGKGAAIKTGYDNSSGDILLFIDADLKNISARKITAIFKPILNNEADFVKTSFTRARGRVTELVVKPLFNVVFPSVKFNQPLSGQFAMRKHLMDELKIDDKWGVDIQILLQLMKKGVRISEVDIGRLAHKKQSLQNLTQMSEQVIKSILSELGIIANKHKLIIFDFDKTIIEESSIEVIAQHFGFHENLKLLRQKYANNKICDSDITLALAKLLKGKSTNDINQACTKLHLSKNIQKVMERLKKRRYDIGIISLAFSPIIDFFAEKLNIPRENIICPGLVADADGNFTGEVIAKTKHNSNCCDKIICKKDSADELMKKINVRQSECIAIADGVSDSCLFEACGLSIAYKPKIKIGDITITNMAEVLIYTE